MDSIILVNGKGTGGNEKTVAIISWFFAGYNLADTIIAITPNNIIIYASDRKVTFLSNLKESHDASRFNLVFEVKSEDFSGSFKKMWTELHGKNTNPKVGMIINDSKTGQTAEEFMKFMEGENHTKVEVISFFN